LPQRDRPIHPPQPILHICVQFALVLLNLRFWPSYFDHDALVVDSKIYLL